MSHIFDSIVTSVEINQSSLLLALGNLRRKAKELLQQNNAIHCKAVPARDTRQQPASQISTYLLIPGMFQIFEGSFRTEQ